MPIHLNKLIKNLAWAVTLFLGVNAIAQETQVIELDPKTNTLKKEIPYDRPFVLKIPIDNDVYYVDYLKTTRNREWYQQINKEAQNSELTLGSIDKSKFEIKKEGEKKYLYVYFDNGISFDEGKKKEKKYNNTFKPNSDYSVILNQFDPLGYEIFKMYHKDGKGSAWSKKLDTARNKQYELYEDLEWSLPTNDEVRQFYKSSNLEEQFVLVENYSDQIDSIVNTITGMMNLEDEVSCLVVDTLKSCGLDCESVKHLLSLNGLDIDNLKLLGKGELSIVNLNGKKELNCDKRVQNLNTTIEHLSAIYSRLKSLELASECALSNLDALENFTNSLRSSRKVLKEACEGEAKIKKTIAQQYFQIPISVDASTSIYNFNTRAKSYIVPDFGLAVYGTGDGFVDFSPYLGFHINFRPMNKDIPWKKYPEKTLLHYTSFMVGWTLKSVAEEGKRDDLFGGSSFFTGLGVKAYSHSIMITGGVLWFNKIDENPVVSEKSLAFAPFVGVSIDLELKELFNGFGNIFSK